MLDLKSGVHLEEVEGAVRTQKKLAGPRTHIVDGARGTYRRRGHLLPRRRSQHRRRRLLEHLLVPSLNAAVALEEVDHLSVTVGQDLDLDVTRVLDELLDIDLVVSKGLAGLRLRGDQRVVEIGLRVHAPHSFAAATRCRLEHHRKSDVQSDPLRLVHIAQRLDRPGNHRNPGLGHELAGCGLAAHGVDGLGRRTNPDQASVDDRARKVGVLG